MELATIISQYLRTNRRLVIPQLGALLVKEPEHRVIFSPLLTRDDGTLHQLIIKSGASEIEATGAIDRLLFDIRYALSNNESFLLEGIGRFVTDQTGAILFIETTTKEEAEEQVKELSTTEREAESQSTTPIPNSTDDKLHPTPLSKQTVENKETKSIFEPDPDLEGLSYGKGPKRSTSRHRKQKKGLDIWMIIAIIVVVAAIAVILYGFLRNGAGVSISNSF